MRPHLIIIYIALSALTACVREEPQQSTDTHVGNFEALWQIIDQRYCFLDYKHVNWDSIHTVYLPQAENAKSSTYLFEVLCNMLAELRDGHVNLSYAADYGHYWKWKEDYPLNFDQELQDAYLGTDYKMAGGIKYRLLNDNIGYIVCGSFNDGFGEGNLDHVFAALIGATGMIIDVRSNSGGNLEYAQSLAARFVDQRTLVGYTSFKSGPGHNDFSEPQAEYISPKSSLRWQKPAVVLTNRSCYSATNTFVRDIRESPYVTVMGDTTGGGSGLPLNTELPNGWSVRLSSAPMFDAQMRHIEFGIAPDIACGLDSALAHRGIDSMIEEARAFIKGN